MRRIPAATPAETGANKGKVQPYEWPTGIAADQNVTGLPVNAKGKVTIALAGDALTVQEPETFAECQELAGEHFETAVLDLFRTRIVAAQLAKARVAFGKLTVAPSDAVAYAQSKIDETDLAAIFAPAERKATGARKSGVTAQIAAVASNVDSMSAEELRAFITQMAARLQK